MPTPSAEPAALLQLLWLASPALPVGAFSYSEGLEAAVDHGVVTDEASAAAWLQSQLELNLARSELPLAAAAIKAWQQSDTERVAALNTWAASTRESAELRQQAEQTGRSMALWLRQMAAAGPPDARIDTLAALQPAPLWPVAWALAAARSGAPVEQPLLALAFGWAENQVQAAVKAVPLGQTAGQRVLQGLTARIPAAVDAALARAAAGDEARQAFAPMQAILSASHETQYSRLFRS
jgi:urease accessory protein